MTPEEKLALVEQALARAEELRRAGSHKEGIHLLVEALQYGLERPRLYRRLGNLYIDAGDLSRAEYAYKRVLELDPNDVNATHNLAVVYKRQKRVSLFVKTYKKAQRLAMRRGSSQRTPRSGTSPARRTRLFVFGAVALVGLVLVAVLLFTRR